MEMIILIAAIVCATVIGLVIAVAVYFFLVAKKKKARTNVVITEEKDKNFCNSYVYYGSPGNPVESPTPKKKTKVIINRSEGKLSLYSACTQRSNASFGSLIGGIKTTLYEEGTPYFELVDKKVKLDVTLD